MELDPMISEKLAQPLDAKRIKKRPAGGSKPALSYLETHDIIRTANEIFGFGQWGHEVVELRLVPGVVITKDGKTGLHVGYVCTVRLNVEGCVPTSGIGFGDAVEYRDAAPVTAHELAAKEAESDALKRALKNFGDQFGLALYAKDAATSGHVTTGGTVQQSGATAARPATMTAEAEAEADALLKLVGERGGDVEKTRTSMVTARKDPQKYAAWMKAAKAHWEAQPLPFKVPAGVS